MRHIRTSLVSALTGVTVLATLVTGTGSANAAPETQINWNTHVEGSTVVAQVSSGGFRHVGNSIELTNAAGAVVLRVPLLFKVADRSIPFTASITGGTLRLTADQGQSEALGLASVSPLPAAQPVAAEAKAIAATAQASEPADIGGSIALGSVIGAAVGGAIGFAAGCALGALGAGAAAGVPTAGVLAIPGAIMGCITVGVTFIQVGTIAGTAVGGGIGAVVGVVDTLLPA